ncbi:hypothetical protein [Blautia sp.]|uniref:hypothetical protein n=1 Tax=Blautia sp. TaxID=1955243 RepID=UPI002582B414|nr:hypothetical protein [Blautia sp.]
MQKLSIEVLENAMKKNLTSAEVDMLLYIAKFQNEAGVARGIYYKDVCRETGISYQAFYDCKKGLEEKGIIYAEKNNYYDWDITIINNSFIGKDNFGRGYVSVSTKMVQSEVFRKFKANTKLMALYLLREWLISRKKSNKDSYQILKENFFAKFRGLLSVSDRMLRKYLGQLKPFLSVYLENGRKYYFTFKKSETTDQWEKSGQGNAEYREHEIQTACRRNRIKEVNKSVKKDVLQLMQQYHVKIRKHLDFSLSDVIHKSLELMNQDKQPAKWRRSINPAFLNKLMQEELF